MSMKPVEVDIRPYYAKKSKVQPKFDLETNTVDYSLRPSESKKLHGLFVVRWEVVWKPRKYRFGLDGYPKHLQKRRAQQNVPPT